MSTISGQLIWPELAAATAEWTRTNGRIMSAGEILRRHGALGLSLPHHRGRDADPPGTMIGRRLQIHATPDEVAHVAKLAARAGVTTQELVTRDLCRIVGTEWKPQIQKQPGPPSQRAAKAAKRRAEQDARDVAQAVAEQEIRAAAEAEDIAKRLRSREPLRVEDMPCPVQSPSAAFLAWLAL